jgi:hypothetical protein
VYGTGSPVISVYDTALMDEWYPGLAYRPEEGAEEVAHSFKVRTVILSACRISYPDRLYTPRHLPVFCRNTFNHKTKDNDLSPDRSFSRFQPRLSPLIVTTTDYARQAVLIANTAPESEAIKRVLENDSERERVI